MRLLSFSLGGRETWGAVVGDQVVDLGAVTGLATLAEFIASPRWAEREALAKAGGFKYPESQTPWQEIQRGMVDELSNGMVLKPAVKYQRIAETKGVPRDNH